MMQDLIRRQDVIDLLEEWGGGFKYLEVETYGAIDAIMDLPFAPPEELTCDGCKYEKTKIFNGMCEYCSRGYDDYYEDGES